jgi:hypothetical protein
MPCCTVHCYAVLSCDVVCCDVSAVLCYAVVCCDVVRCDVM